MVVVLEFREREKVIPVVLSLINKNTEKLFQLLINSLCLSISLGVICGDALYKAYSLIEESLMERDRGNY